jgi:hypothetical protein
MQHGRDHQEREQKNATRVAEQLRRDDPDAEAQSFTRQARSTDPAPTPKAVEQERERHASAGTVGGNVDRSRG